MNIDRWVGIVLSTVGFVMTAAAGLWLARQVSEGADLGTILINALVVFVPIALVVVAGGYLYLRSRRDDNPDSFVRKQRDLLDLLHERGKINFSEAALLLSVPEDAAQEMIQQLISLQVFRGAVNWKEGWVAAPSIYQSNSMICPHCGAALQKQGMPVSCAQCETAYYSV